MGWSPIFKANSNREFPRPAIGYGKLQKHVKSKQQPYNFLTLTYLDYAAANIQHAALVFCLLRVHDNPADHIQLFDCTTQ